MSSFLLRILFLSLPLTTLAEGPGDKSREGPSGLRCEICQELASVSSKMFKEIRKNGLKLRGDLFLPALQRRVCQHSRGDLLTFSTKYNRVEEVEISQIVELELELCSSFIHRDRHQKWRSSLVHTPAPGGRIIRSSFYPPQLCCRTCPTPKSMPCICRR